MEAMCTGIIIRQVIKMAGMLMSSKKPWKSILWWAIAGAWMRTRGDEIVDMAGNRFYIWITN
jgi:hypothetical protein